MSQGNNETAVSFGTMDANGSEMIAQIKAMIIELQQLGRPGVQAILDKYGFTTVDWASTTGFHIRSKDKSKFLG